MVGSCQLKPIFKAGLSKKLEEQGLSLAQLRRGARWGGEGMGRTSRLMIVLSGFWRVRGSMLRGAKDGSIIGGRAKKMRVYRTDRIFTRPSVLGLGKKHR